MLSLPLPLPLHDSDVQSPTVGTAMLVPPPVATTMVEEVGCRYASQLLLKHNMIRETIQHQKHSLDFLREVIQVRDASTI